MAVIRDDTIVLFSVCMSVSDALLCFMFVSPQLRFQYQTCVSCTERVTLFLALIVGVHAIVHRHLPCQVWIIVG